MRLKILGTSRDVANSSPTPGMPTLSAGTVSPMFRVVRVLSVDEAGEPVPGANVRDLHLESDAELDAYSKVVGQTIEVPAPGIGGAL